MQWDFRSLPLPALCGLAQKENTKRHSPLMTQAYLSSLGLWVWGLSFDSDSVDNPGEVSECDDGGCWCHIGQQLCLA